MRRDERRDLMRTVGGVLLVIAPLSYLITDQKLHEGHIEFAGNGSCTKMSATFGSSPATDHVTHEGAQIVIVAADKTAAITDVRLVSRSSGKVVPAVPATDNEFQSPIENTWQIDQTVTEMLQGTDGVWQIAATVGNRSVATPTFRLTLTNRLGADAISVFPTVGKSPGVGCEVVTGR